MADDQEAVADHSITSVLKFRLKVPKPTEIRVQASEIMVAVGSILKVYHKKDFLFYIDGTLASFPNQRVMYESSTCSPFLTMRETGGGRNPLARWTVHQGRPEAARYFRDPFMNLLYSVQRSQLPGRGLSLSESNHLQIVTRFDVNLANNYGNYECDYHVIKCYRPPSKTFIRVYKRDTVIAEAKIEVPWSKFCRGKGNLLIKLASEGDCVFVVTLSIIVNEIVIH